jgi:hypothetical protein
MQESDIRLYTKTFVKQDNFNPEPTVHFKQEFGCLTSTQLWTKDEICYVEIEKINQEIIAHYLRTGSSTADQHNDDNTVNLTDEQTLEIYQNMLRSTAGKQVHDGIESCLRELKARPFVNITNFINTFQTGKAVRKFEDWEELVEYTLDRNKSNVQLAKENELLAPLLQDSGRGPYTVNPIGVRQGLLYRRRLGRITFTTRWARVRHWNG